jgi:hypothetical protein
MGSLWKNPKVPILLVATVYTYKINKEIKLKFQLVRSWNGL